MIIGKSPEELKVRLENDELEQVTKFVYLGGMVTEDGECGRDMQRRTSLASAMVAKLSKIRKSPSISLRTKVKVYEAIVIPVFLYRRSVGACAKMTRRRSSQQKWDGSDE